MAITFSVDKQVLPPANDSSTRDDIDELLYEQLLKRVSKTTYFLCIVPNIFKVGSSLITTSLNTDGGKCM